MQVVGALAMHAVIFNDRRLVLDGGCSPPEGLEPDRVNFVGRLFYRQQCIPQTGVHQGQADYFGEQHQRVQVAF